MVAVTEIDAAVRSMMMRATFWEALNPIMLLFGLWSSTVFGIKADRWSTVDVMVVCSVDKYRGYALLTSKPG